MGIGNSKQISDLTIENNGLKEENSKLLVQIKKLEQGTSDPRAKIDEFEKKNSALTEENNRLKQENPKFLEQINKLKEENSDLTQQNEQLKQDNFAFTKDKNALENNRLALFSQTDPSSKFLTIKKITLNNKTISTDSFDIIGNIENYEINIINSEKSFVKTFLLKNEMINKDNTTLVLTDNDFKFKFSTYKIIIISKYHIISTIQSFNPITSVSITTNTKNTCHITDVNIDIYNYNLGDYKFELNINNYIITCENPIINDNQIILDAQINGSGHLKIFCNNELIGNSHTINYIPSNFVFDQ